MINNENEPHIDSQDDEVKSEKDEKELFRLYINRRFYILVDDNGNPMPEDTREGALGYVIRLYNHIDSNIYAALKFPKLIGATHRENVYISELMAQEAQVVEHIFAGSNDGLLDKQEIDTLRRPINVEGLTGEPSQLHNGLIFLSYQAGQPPTFSVAYENKDSKVSIFPNSTSLPVEVSMLEAFSDFRQQIAIKTQVESNVWQKMLFLQETQNSGQENRQYSILDKDEASRKNPADKTWYVCIPSVIYNWAHGTFQEAISSGVKSPWNGVEHLKFLKKVCQGLDNLHQKKVIHADIRPANIVYPNTSIVNDPENYTLADFGSLGLAPADIPKPIGGGTIVSANPLQGERSSVFYAPERYKGQERETADRAFIIKDPSQEVSHVVLGWQSQLNREKAELAANSPLPVPTEDTYLPETSLQKGDRVRIQDFVFELSGAEYSIEGFQVLPCKAEVFRISQGRIAIRDTEIPIPDELPVDRIIEMQQWSAATDLYSLGVLLLYSIFLNTIESPEKKYQSNVVEDSISERSSSNADDQADDTVSENSIERNPVDEVKKDKENFQASEDVEAPSIETQKETEEKFRQMLNYLASPPFFQIIWPELDALCQELEKKFSEPGVEVDKQIFPAADYYGDLSSLVESDSQVVESDTELTLLDHTKKVINSITTTAPHTRRIVAALDFNLSAFVLIMHFVLACLHRGESISNESRTEKNRKPFCKSRLERPEGKASKAALKRLEVLITLVEDRAKRFQKFSIAHQENNLEKVILPHSSASDFKIRQQNMQLKQQNTILNNRVSDYSELASTNSELRSLQESLNKKIKIFENGIQKAIKEYEDYESNWLRKLNKSGIDRRVEKILKQTEKDAKNKDSLSEK